MRTLNDLKIVLKYLDYILQNPKLALPLQCYRHGSLPTSHGRGQCPDILKGFFYAQTYIQPYGCHPNHYALARVGIVFVATDGSRFFITGRSATAINCLATNTMQYERIDPVGHTTPRPSRDSHRSQIPGPVHNPVARTPRRGHQAHADAVTHPHRRRRPIGCRGHVVLVVVRHDGRCHAVAHAGRVVGCRPRLGSIGITDINNGRR